jgi:hypothetical protein
MNNHEFSLPRHFLKRHIIDRHSVGLRPEAGTRLANFAREFFLHTAFSAHQATTRNVRICTEERLKVVASDLEAGEETCSY